MDYTTVFFCFAREFISGNTLCSFRRPECTNVCKYLCTICEKSHKEHSETVENIVFGCERHRFACAFKIERGVEKRFGIVTVRPMVCPLSLTLESCANSVVTEHFFFKTFGKVFVSADKISYYKIHLNREFPLFFFLLGSKFDSSLFTEEVNKVGVVVSALFAMLFCPRKSTFIVFFIVNAFFHTTKNFNFVYGFNTHSEIFFYKLLIDDRSADAHAHRTDLEIALATHFGSGNCSATETKKLFFYVFGNVCNIAYILNFMTVEAKCGKSLLCVSCKNGCQINRTGTFCSVKAPNAFYSRRIHIHCLCTVTPTRCYRKSNCNIFFFEFFRTCSGFWNTTDSCISHYNLNRSTV